MSLKIAIDAGHGMDTPGKRIPVDAMYAEPNNRGCREWWLNSRIVEKVEILLAEYDCEVYRMDDPTGATDIPLSKRHPTTHCDLFLSVHHNAGINGGTGGGVVVYTRRNPTDTETAQADAFYKCVVGRNGNKGNRANPISQANYDVLVNSNCKISLLLENGFMDSAVDADLICTTDYAQKTIDGIMDYLVSEWGLKRKVPAAAEPEYLYKVQVGAFGNKTNADNLLKQLKAAGFDGYIRKEERLC